MLRDLKIACVFLTRLPLRIEGDVSLRDLAGTVHLFPVVGVIVGGAAAVVFALAGALGLPPLAGAALALAAMVLITGALHEDGLADTAEALAAGEDRERALAIMRENRIGSAGASAIVLVLLARMVALGSFWDPALFARAVVAAAVTSRAAMAVVMLVQPSARERTGNPGANRPRREKVVIGTGLAVALALLVTPAGTGLAGLAAAALVATGVAAWLGRRFGGCTGDTLSAIQQLTETAFLLAVVATL